MDTLPFKPVELLAIDPARNIRRRWRIAASRDLFDQIIVETSWGRIGAAGRAMVRSFPDEQRATRYVAGLLRLRGTAQRRIGVGYAPVQPGAV